MRTKALYAGAFDPLTLGHLNIIERASKIFDEVVIGVTVNLQKNTMFSFEERVDMISHVTADMPNVTADKCEGLLADYVNENGFNVVIRGLRGVGDLDMELRMAQLHRHLYKEGVETLFLMSDVEYSFISSTMAKQVISLGGDGSMLVPPYVLNIMKGRMEGKMEDTTKVLDLLDELEDLLEEGKSLPLTSKVMLETQDLFAIVKEVRLALPDDIQQAKWIKDERDRILNDAKSEYERIIREAKKQAEYLIETDDITKKARQLAAEIIQDAELNARLLKMKTYDYVDKMLYDMQEKMDELNLKYFGEMFTNLEGTFNIIGDTLAANREEIKNLAYKTQSEAGSEGVK